MVRTENKIAIAAFLVAVAVASEAAPASAGSVKFTLTPKRESAQAVQTGLSLYSRFRSLKNHARTDQKGTGNGAAITQHGSGNFAKIFQRGHNNSGSITQNGNNDAYAIFQFGRNQQTSAVQSGDGKVGVTFQGNW